MSDIISTVLKAAVNTIFDHGFDIIHIFKFLKPLQITDIQIVLNNDYLAILGVPNVKKIDRLDSLSVLNGLSDLPDLNDIIEAITPKPKLIKETFKKATKHVLENMSEEEARGYLEHSSMKGIKAALTAAKLIEQVMDSTNKSEDL